MNERNYIRTFYLNKVTPYINKPFIKILTGVRRCGKSYLLKQIIELLISERKVKEEQIVYINKELLKFDFIKDYKKLYDYINEQLSGINGKKYIFVDEIQNIDEWEKTISSFFAEGEYDIYITGSNSNLLSSEFATLLSGRYIEFNLYTLSFEEFTNFRQSDEKDNETEFYNYLKYGGFPVVQHLEDDEELIFQYLNSLYNTILLKDIISRYKIRNIQLFENLTKFVFQNIGNTFSAASISKYLKSQKQSVGLDTIQNYLTYLENSFLITKVKRFDLKGKKILELYEKYYLADIGIKNAMFGYKENEIPGLLENLVFHKLKQLNYKIFIGKFDEYEIDFVAEKKDNRIYIQVAYLLDSEKTVEREFHSLKLISDNYPKYVLTLNKHQTTNNEGIIRMNLVDFLLNYKA